MDRIKILQVIGRLQFGGMQGGVIKVDNHIDRDIFHPLLVSFRGFDQPLKNNLAPDVEFAVIQRKAGRDWRLVRKLANIFVKQRVDIVHSHNWETWLYSFPAARLAHLPVFILGEYGREATYLSERGLKQKCGIQIRVK